MRKQLVTLNIGGYCPAITEITFPAMERWAKKIGAVLPAWTDDRITSNTNPKGK